MKPLLFRIISLALCVCFAAFTASAQSRADASGGEEFSKLPGDCIFQTFEFGQDGNTLFADAVMFPEDCDGQVCISVSSCAGPCEGDVRPGDDDDDDGACNCDFDGSGGSCVCTGTGSARECTCKDGQGNSMRCYIDNNNCVCESIGDNDGLSCSTSLQNEPSCKCSASGQGASCSCSGTGSAQVCTCSDDQNGTTTCKLVNNACQCT